ncbi:hypothetical protein M8818_002895 [Zalaria obscura]|uniref:Uncharacterized protein n=1 Tax=Zalaria obscura TaxID=2024903 RepID=A0ACC3SI33_9PEZI
MPSRHPFIPVWQTDAGRQTVRAKHYGFGRKRKRTQEDEDEEDSDSPEAYFAPPDEVPRANTRYIGDTERTDPYHVAGLSSDETLPPPPFPHAALKPSKNDPNADGLRQELSDLNPPLYVPENEAEDPSTSLRRHHLNVLTTLMHTSLLRGDYVRAGRAWGMILRTDFKTRGIDVRSHGRWGIGAEILLRRDGSAPTRPDEAAEADERGAQEDDVVPSPEITEQGFQTAREYYERLILQYPYQKFAPNAVNALSFYPAMFGLTIYEAQEKTKRALARLETASHDDTDATYPDEDQEDETTSRAEDFAAIKQHELDTALRLAAKMDEVLISPPYDKYIPLLQLRGMVALWVADLHEDAVLPSKSDEARAEVDNQRARDLATEHALAEREKARSCFRKVKDGGGEVPEAVAHLIRG